MNKLASLQKKIPEIEKLLGYTFQNRHLLEMALTHRSFVNENRDLTESNNERLEFLGDSVLGLLVSDFLYEALPTSREGSLSHLRAGLVDSGSCVTYLNQLEIASFALMGKGEMLNEGRGRESILADLFEAILGAIYLDGGIESVRNFFFSHFGEKLKAMVSKPQKNWKALLQDYSQKNFQRPPEYVVVKETGPDHLKEFTISVRVQDKVLGEGNGVSKKQAQQEAAKNALETLGIDG